MKWIRRRGGYIGRMPWIRKPGKSYTIPRTPPVEMPRTKPSLPVPYIRPNTPVVYETETQPKTQPQGTKPKVRVGTKTRYRRRFVVPRVRIRTPWGNLISRRPRRKARLMQKVQRIGTGTSRSFFKNY